MRQVVDSNFQVLGSQNLRVIDASIQPTIVVGGTQASTLMIAEKGASTILRKWRAKPRSLFTYIFDKNGRVMNPLKNLLRKSSKIDPMSMFNSLFRPMKSFQLTSPFSKSRGPKYTSPSGDKYYSHDPSAALFLQNLIDKVSFSGSKKFKGVHDNNNTIAEANS